MKIAITGHRPNKLGNDYSLTSPLIIRIKEHLESIIDKYAKHRLTLISGMALGIDTLWAQLAVENNIPFIAAIPDLAQADRWPPKSQTVYYRLLEKAQEVVNVSKSTIYKIEHLQQRNIWMVDNCNLLIAVWDGTPGGTANCINYAHSVKRFIIRINPKSLIV